MDDRGIPAGPLSAIQAELTAERLGRLYRTLYGEETPFRLRVSGKGDGGRRITLYCDPCNEGHFKDILYENQTGA